MFKEEISSKSRFSMSIDVDILMIVLCKYYSYSGELIWCDNL